MAFKKILLEGDAASLSTNTPVNVGTTAAAGSGTAASKDDHVHDTAIGFIDSADKFAAGVVDAAAIGANAVSASELADAAVDVAAIQTAAVSSNKIDTTNIYVMNELVLSSKVSSAMSTSGTIMFDSSDDHLYVYTS